VGNNMRQLNLVQFKTSKCNDLENIDAS
jgi:hypothetical protein